MAPSGPSAGAAVCGLFGNHFFATNQWVNGTTRDDPSGAPGERAMPAASVEGGQRGSRVARSLLKADGTLKAPEVEVGDLALMAGDRVVVRAAEGTDLPPPETPGTVDVVEVEAGTVDVD